MDLWKGHFCQSDDEIVLVFAKMDEGGNEKVFCDDHCSCFYV